MLRVAIPGGSRLPIGSRFQVLNLEFDVDLRVFSIRVNVSHVR
jgi:hypothetical protein